jgi:glucose 1-dehydrogenase
MKLDGKVAVVTGGARGIGAAIAREFAREGAQVAIFDVAKREQAREVLDQIAATGRTAIYTEGSVTDRDAVSRMMEGTVAELGGLDILVNNAALNLRGHLIELTVEQIRRTWDVTLWGVVNCTQVAAQLMVKQGRGGNIISISSVQASRAAPRSSIYNGSKAAINQMSATWAVELAPHRIRVNVIEPGWIDTPGERAFMSDEDIYKEGANLLMGRLGSPEEIARGAIYLASNDGSYCTGTMLRIDGGYVLPED